MRRNDDWDKYRDEEGNPAFDGYGKRDVGPHGNFYRGLIIGSVLSSVLSGLLLVAIALLIRLGLAQ